MFNKPVQIALKRSTCSVCGVVLRGWAKLGQRGEIYCADCHKFYVDYGKKSVYDKR